MGTKTNPGAFDCYAAALPDEPIFHLLGRDPAFPATVEFWARERTRLGKVETNDDLKRVGEANLIAGAAKRWRQQLVDATPEGDPYPWQNRGHVDAYDRDPAVRHNADAWEGTQGGPVRMQEIIGWTAWAVAGSLAIAQFKFGMKAVPTMKALAEMIDGTERAGWHLENLNSHNWGYEAVFRRSHFDEHYSAAVPLRQDVNTNLSVAVQDNLVLRAKAVVGLNQLANDLSGAISEAGWGPERFGEFMTFVDRVNGYAAELGDGVPVDMLPLPQVDPARGADDTHPTVAVVPEDTLDFGDAEEPLELTEDMRLHEDPPADCDCGGTLDRCRNKAHALYASLNPTEVGRLKYLEGFDPNGDWGAITGVIHHTAEVSVLCRIIGRIEAILGERGVDMGAGQEP
jgi:hypothetical protein